MSDTWDTVKDALSSIDVDSAPAKVFTEEEIRHHGWAQPTAYNYARYANDDAAGATGATGVTDDAGVQEDDSTDAVAAGGAKDPNGGLGQEEWESSAARYEWKDEYGEVGPRHPELEKLLFGGVEEHVRAGALFMKLNQNKVVQEGVIKLVPVFNFDHAGLHPVMRENVRLAGYDTPTLIQAYAMPAIFKGYDIIACAQTGSGKTAAFFIPTLSKLMGKAKKLAAPRPNPATFQEGIDRPVTAEPLLLVVCPSRELAVQIFNEARRFCYRSMLRPCVIYGGGPRREQVRELAKGCDVLIGTPGRLCDFLRSPNTLSLRRLKYMIIDEADELLNTDWSEDLNKIMNGSDQEQGNITYMMFSATFPKVARDLAKAHLAADYVRIRVGRAGSMHENVVQSIVWVEPNLKRNCLIDLLMSMPPARTIIFVNSKHTADELDDYLFNLGLPSTSIHSDRTQLEREDALRAFRRGDKPILVATGVSARGLDVPNVMHVVNYDLPAHAHGGLEEYAHRIGRTARIGNKGLATSFYNERDSDIAEQLTHFLQESKQEVPNFLEQFKADDVAALKFEADSDTESEAGDDDADKDGGAVKDDDAESEPGEVGDWTPAEAKSDAKAGTVGGWRVAEASEEAPAPAMDAWTSAGIADW